MIPPSITPIRVAAKDIEGVGEFKKMVQVECSIWTIFIS